MANNIQYANVFQDTLDKAAIEQATSGWMENNTHLVKYNGGNEVKIPKLALEGLADYKRNGGGFVDGNIELTYQTETLSMDRGRKFTFDENDVDETNFILTASAVMGEFQRTKVVPEIDAYRYSKIAAKAITASRASGGYNPTSADILQKLYADVANVQDEIGDDSDLIITISTKVAAILDSSAEISKNISVGEFAQGDVKLKIKMLNGQHPIIRVGSGRLKTLYTFNDGTTSGQTVGGFKPHANAKDINWIICPKNAVIAVSKTDKVRIFDPETYQKSRSWAIDYRKYHDVWIPDNNLKTIFVNVKQALA